MLASAHSWLALNLECGERGTFGVDDIERNGEGRRGVQQDYCESPPKGYPEQYEPRLNEHGIQKQRAETEDDDRGRVDRVMGLEYESGQSPKMGCIGRFRSGM